MKSSDGSENSGEMQPLSTVQEIKVYKRRWYVLAVFSLFSAIQGHIWSTWNPIVRPAKAAFGWTNADITTLVNWGCLTNLLLTALTSWLITVFGFRAILVFNAGLVAVGSVIRLVPVNPGLFFIFAHLGSLLNCMATVASTGFVILSALWFPPNERTTATAISAALNTFGVASAFIIVPRMVPDEHHHVNRTDLQSSNDYLPTTEAAVSFGNSTVHIERTRRNIMNMLYMHAGLACGIFLLILIYFPARPKLPPSGSAAVVRENYWVGMKSLAVKLSFWQVVIPWALVVGVYCNWSAFVDLNLKDLGIPQSSTGNIGFLCRIASSLGMFIFARMSDIFQRKMKAYLIFAQVLFAIFILWFSLMSEKIVTPSLVQFYVSATMASFLVGGCVPLYYELCCETTYPASEPVSMSAQMIPLDVTGLIFNLLFFLPNIGTSWMNWVQAAVCIPAIVILCFYKENYGRLDIDIKTTNNDKEKSTLLN